MRLSVSILFYYKRVASAVTTILDPDRSDYLLHERLAWVKNSVKVGFSNFLLNQRKLHRRF